MIYLGLSLNRNIVVICLAGLQEWQGTTRTSNRLKTLAWHRQSIHRLWIVYLSCTICRLSLNLSQIHPRNRLRNRLRDRLHSHHRLRPCRAWADPKWVAPILRGLALGRYCCRQVSVPFLPSILRRRHTRPLLSDQSLGHTNCSFLPPSSTWWYHLFFG